VSFADHRRPGERRRLGSPRDWLLVSSDAGHAFSEPLLISETCNVQGGWSVVAVAPEGTAYADRIYHACSAGVMHGIEVRYSDTRGDTWSTPVLLGGSSEFTAYVRTPALSVNSAGVVGVAWYDGRNDRSSIKGFFRCQEIYFTASLDGGATFLPDQKVSGGMSCPATSRNIDAALRFPAGGEYMGIDTSPDGSFHLLWSDARSGVYQLRQNRIEVRSRGTSPDGRSH
jgi:hypothetical protein